MTLFMVCDISGSMADLAKPFIMRTTVMTIAQWVRLGYGRTPIRLCAWAGEAYFPDWSENQEYPAQLLACRGTSSVAALIQLLGTQPEGKILLLSDGFWSHADTKLLKQWSASLPPDTLRIIKTGADANPRLKGPYVFVTDELFAALDGWLEDCSA
ncbi:hypothetical protein CFBP1590__2960 [Pseudomonas viridiflava]|uniref:VWA domain-containing protein n=1 Tax=Pseudomonas viridiflava TaxID=33069 RepID=A0A1Y6JKS3_PSEVI|nr:hypothetical protein [Pseudomonas viridiflava]PCK92885.1 hypothetical protein PsyrCH409_06225 [Pseudomonas viridiflava]SMS10546.1 hypothetical protein CFBP1590__2960 [Pseudomonas viridiflava]VVO08983.1 hypothetical protein PS689_03287 [Pseudomonas fluorescens]